MTALQTSTEAVSLWSPWAEATEMQRTYFKTEQTHYAWSRTCGGCGEGDFLERKQMPTNNDAGLRGRRIPVLPEVIAEGQRPGRFLTPAHRTHSCASAGKLR